MINDNNYHLSKKFDLKCKNTCYFYCHNTQIIYVY